MNTRFLPALLLGLMLSVLPGCGGSGSGGGGGSVKPGATALASAHFVVKWPAPAAADTAAPHTASSPHVIPVATKSILFSVYHDDKEDIDAMGHPKNGSVPLKVDYIDPSKTSDTLPVPALIPIKIFIQAKPSSDGTGTTLAESSVSLTLKNGETKDYSGTPITLGSTVTQVVITPASTQEAPDATHKGPISLVIGQPNSLQLSAQAEDKDNNVVLTAPGTITWALAAGSDATVATVGAASGAITPLKPGSVGIAATYQEAGHPETSVSSASAAYIKIVAPGGIGGQNNISYLLNTTLTFGSWGVEYPGSSSNFQNPVAVAVHRSGNGTLYVYTGDKVTDGAQSFGGSTAQNYNGPEDMVLQYKQILTGNSAQYGYVTLTGNPLITLTTDARGNPSESAYAPLYSDGSFLNGNLNNKGAEVQSLAVDKSGTVFILLSNRTIRVEVPNSDDNPTQFSGTSFPCGTKALQIAVDDNDDVFITAKDQVLVATKSSGGYTVQALPLLLNGFTYADGIAVDPSGKALYVTDYFAKNVYKFITNTPGNNYQLDSSFGNNGFVRTKTTTPAFLALDSRIGAVTGGNLYVSDGSVVAHYDQFGSFINDLNDTVSPLFAESQLAVDDKGLIYIADTGSPNTVLHNQDQNSPDFGKPLNTPPNNRIAVFSPQ